MILPKEVQEALKEIIKHKNSINDILQQIMEWAKLGEIKDEKNLNFKMKIMNELLFLNYEEIEKILKENLKNK